MSGYEGARCGPSTEATYGVPRFYGPAEYETFVFWGEHCRTNEVIKAVVTARNRRTAQAVAKDNFNHALKSTRRDLSKGTPDRVVKLHAAEY